MADRVSSHAKPQPDFPPLPYHFVIIPLVLRKVIVVAIIFSIGWYIIIVYSVSMILRAYQVKVRIVATAAKCGLAGGPHASLAAASPVPGAASQNYL